MAKGYASTHTKCELKEGQSKKMKEKNKYIEVYERPKIQHFIWRDIKVFL